MCLSFVIYIFIQCEHNILAGSYGKKLTTPFCSRSCVCDSDIRFTPVCPADSIQTYFSPCHAGCTSDRIMNGKRVFGDCSCGVDTDRMLTTYAVDATEGACGYDNCQKMWIIFHILCGFTTVCYGSRLVGKILISLRSVLRQDTAIALALQLNFVGLLAYIPGKIAYQNIAGEIYRQFS